MRALLAWLIAGIVVAGSAACGGKSDERGAGAARRSRALRVLETKAELARVKRELDLGLLDLLVPVGKVLDCAIHRSAERLGPLPTVFTKERILDTLDADHARTLRGDLERFGLSCRVSGPPLRWEGVFRRIEGPVGFVAALRTEDGAWWVARFAERGSVDSPFPRPPLSAAGEAAVLDAKRAKGGAERAVTWWDLESCRKEFAAEVSTDSIWEDEERIGGLWREALDAVARELPGEGPAPEVPVVRVDDLRDGPDDHIPVGYWAETGELHFSPRMLRCQAAMSGSDLMGDQVVVSLVLLHEAVHVMDLKRSLTLRMTSNRRSEARGCAFAVLEGHADLVARRIAAARGLGEEWDRYRRQRQRAMYASPVGLEDLVGRRASDADLPASTAELYDLGLRLVEARAERRGPDGVSDLLFRPPIEFREIFAEIAEADRR
jgi:hypothetical protein